MDMATSFALASTPLVALPRQSLAALRGELRLLSKPELEIAVDAMAGNLDNFEEAARALFAGDRARFEQLVARWPHDIRVHATLLAFTYSGSGE